MIHCVASQRGARRSSSQRVWCRRSSPHETFRSAPIFDDRDRPNGLDSTGDGTYPGGTILTRGNRIHQLAMATIGAPTATTGIGSSGECCQGGDGTADVEAACHCRHTTVHQVGRVRYGPSRCAPLCGGQAMLLLRRLHFLRQLVQTFGKFRRLKYISDFAFRQLTFSDFSFQTFIFKTIGLNYFQTIYCPFFRRFTDIATNQHDVRAG